MLPFHLRDSRHGAKKGTKRHRPNDTQDEYKDEKYGGLVQSAITNDLIDLRKRFRKQLLDHARQRPVSQDHWKPGVAFSIFKDLFGPSKIGMLHLLSPAKCDREAYSQLIYASCLALFKESFVRIERRKIGEISLGVTQDEDNSVNYYDDAGFAIFALLALFETNPLPRGIGNENPLELIPTNQRASQRRCFSRKIRVDRKCFSLMLRMKEVTLAEKSNAQRSFYESQRLDLKGSKPDQRRNNSKIQTGAELLSHCSCGMTTDILEVLERIFPVLELCEYTGPVGAEAFAGHAEYPYDRSISCHQTNVDQTNCMIRKEMDSWLASENQCDHIDSSNEYSDEVTSLLQKYKESVTAIRLPLSKSKAVSRVQIGLQPLFSQIKNVRSDDSNKDQCYQYTEKTDSVSQTERDENEVGFEANRHFDASRGESESSKDSIILQNYKVVLNGDIENDLKKALHASMLTLLTRHKHMSPLPNIANGTSKSSLDADDVSSIGHGGISIGTRLASRKVRSAGQRRGEQKIVRQSLANTFLTSKQSINPEASSEEDSVNSEITILSLSDSEGGIDDEMSMATSAFGKRALENLLQNVTEEDINIDGKNTKKKPRRKNKTKQKGKSPSIKDSRLESKANDKGDDVSVATSAFGKRALENLLNQVASKDMVVGGTGINNSHGNKQKLQPKTTKKRMGRKAIVNASSLGSKDAKEDEQASVATSAHGKKALEDLLRNVDGDQNVNHNKKERQSKPRSTKTLKKEKHTDKASSSESEDNREGEEASAVTSAYGKGALEELLGNVDGDQNVKRNKKERQSKPRSTKTQKKEKYTAKASSSESEDNRDGEEASAATSAHGKRALEELLGNVDGDQNVNRNKKKRQSKPWSTKTRKKGKHTAKASSSESGDSREDEEASIGTSTFGKKALDDLLQKIA